MKGNAGLTVATILLVCAFSSAPGQAPDVLGKQKAFESLFNQRKEDLRRKGLDICFSFDDTGSVSKISFQSNQRDQFGLRSIMKQIGRASCRERMNSTKVRVALKKTR